MPSEALDLPARAGRSRSLLPAPLIQTGEEVGAWCCGAVPAFLLSAEGAGAGAFPNFRGRTEGLQGGPGQEEIISFHTNGLAISSLET